MKHLLLTLGVLLSGYFAHTQTVQVLDAETQEPIPFVKVTCSGKIVVADIDGYFSLNCANDPVRFQSMEYGDTTFVIGNTTKVFLNAVGNDIEEVVVSAIDKEANRIMEQAADRRKSNHPKGKESFQYTSYSKFIFTLNPDALVNVPDSVLSDTSLVDMLDFFGQQHLFMMESTTIKSFAPPYREKEEITAYKVSGFTDPQFASFASELQTFHFYENQFTLMGETFTSPIAFGNTRRYWFQLKGTTVNPGGDSTFHIRFRPYFDKNFVGMKGELYINSANYAIEKVIAEPAEKSETLVPRIVQEYRLVDGHWFPYKLSTEATMPGITLTSKLKDAYIVAKGTTYLENLKFNVDLSDEKFNAAEVITKADAGDKDSTHWNKERNAALNAKELRTYESIDSISDVYHLQTKLDFVSSLMEGKLRLGYVQADLNRLINFHSYEGYRLGLGLENSPKLMKRVTVGGYFGYGTRDKAWKYGAYSRIMLFPKQFIGMELKYQDDIAQRGGMETYKGSLISLNEVSQDFYILQMDKQRLASIGFNGFLQPTVEWHLGANYQRLHFTQGYEFYRNGQILTGMEQAEASAELIWRIGEKVKYLGYKRVSSGSKYPQLRARFINGISGLGNSAMNYQRFIFEVNESVQLRAAGRLQTRFIAMKTVGDVPLFYLNVANGTGGNWNLSVPNTFETMQSSTYYQSDMAAFFFRYTTKKWKTNLKWTAPQIGAHFAMGTGSNSHSGSHSIPISSMSKGYYETGLILQNVLISGISGIGIGAFVPFGPLVSPDLSKTVTFKLAFTVNLN